MENFETEFRTGHWRYCKVTLTSCTILVGFVKLNQMPKKAHIHTFVEHGSFFACAHLHAHSHHLYIIDCLPTLLYMKTYIYMHMLAIMDMYNVVSLDSLFTSYILCRYTSNIYTMIDVLHPLLPG